MNPGAALQEEYRRCLERDFRRGHMGVCADSSLKQVLWRQLLEEPELHCALQGEDTFAMIAGALRGQLDLGVALQNLCRAFEVLELAAVNLYFFPWRKEFSTIKTFSGVYVHVLQGVLSEADIARSFHRMGYVQRDNLHLVISQLPPGAGLLRVACSFFAARVECEILGKIVEETELCGISSEELLQARREVRGGLEGCVAQLQSLARWPRGKDFCTEPADGVDLYGESPEEPNRYGEPPGSRLPPLHQPAPYERSSCSPRLRSKELHARSPQGLPEGRSKLWGPGLEQPYGNGLMASEGPDLETSFSFISLRRELSRLSDTDSSPVQPGSQFLSPIPHYGSSSPQPRSPSSPASPSARQPRSPQLSPLGLRRAQGLVSGVMGPEPPRYHLHSCLLPGALPSSCCGSCRLLHGSGCEMAQHCRSAHHVEELQSEKQQRLWLQRTEVDKLL
ncbi:spermatogenesis-associated protein 2-like protein [Heteronotia binoei]|uniref:spermatogenesis-associated protein 2-like protein n=1 Tax=Heteronotia binoei TaxID=13085 RepID=UPI0029311458|nr:spermatogenesis-associated protein 2-like protein [Heteronotia binoei]XP_060110448.1 spermatogenesis-associated protein 2-like protein [Heteronotia binoei]